MGAGPGTARSRFVSPIARRAGAGPFCDRQPRGVLRAVAPMLGGGRGELSDLPHPLERHASRPRSVQHAAAQRRAVAGITADLAGKDLRPERFRRMLLTSSYADP